MKFRLLVFLCNDLALTRQRNKNSIRLWRLPYLINQFLYTLLHRVSCVGIAIIIIGRGRKMEVKLPSREVYCVGIEIREISRGLQFDFPILRGCHIFSLFQNFPRLFYPFFCFVFLSSDSRFPVPSTSPAIIA